MTSTKTELKLPRPQFFDLDMIFDCGQAFRFEKADGVWSGVAYGKALRVRQDEQILYLNITKEEYDSRFKHYFALDSDYGEIRADIANHFPSDRVMAAAMEKGRGIRVLNQEPWETLCSFIISQNNNIPRIKSLIQSISRACGDRFEYEGDTYYAFPTPAQLYSFGVDGLRELKTGFRAEYLTDAARRVLDGLNLCDIRDNMTYEQGLAELCEIKGVGPKVASCTLLFALEKHSAFPVDVWIRRTIDKYYGGKLDTTALGDYAGIAQQYLFYYERYTNDIKA